MLDSAKSTSQYFKTCVGGSSHADDAGADSDTGVRGFKTVEVLPNVKIPREIIAEKVEETVVQWKDLRECEFWPHRGKMRIDL